MVIILRNTPDGQRRRRSIEVNKYRRSAHYKGEYPCTITARGLAIFPLDAQDRPSSTRCERYSSGSAPASTQMLGGGLVRDSINIVRGPTGSGKTMLAGLYARAGAERGERVVYYGFEEPAADPPAQLRPDRHAHGRAREARATSRSSAGIRRP